MIKYTCAGICALLLVTVFYLGTARAYKQCLRSNPIETCILILR